MLFAPIGPVYKYAVRIGKSITKDLKSQKEKKQALYKLGRV